MHIITGICAQFLRIIIIQGSESKQISSCQIESDTLNAQLGQKLSLPESISDFQILQTLEKPLNFDPFGHARFAHLFVLYD